MKRLLLLFVYFTCIERILSQKDREEDGRNGIDRLKIEGVIEKPFGAKNDKNWITNTRIYTETGQTAFIRENGTFVLHNLYWGVHFLYVSNPTTTYAPVRIDLLAKGKMRVRKFNVLQPTKVEVIPGPLRLVPMAKTQYFQAREQWRITDLIMNPMLLITVVPLALVLLLPKQDLAPQGNGNASNNKAPVQNQNGAPQTPDLSEMMMNVLQGRPALGNPCENRRPVPSANRGGRRRDK